MTHRLSPNQKATSKFPVVGENAPSDVISEWQLEITGLVKRPLRWRLEEFLRLPMTEVEWDTICVTGWTHFGHRWRGVHLRTLLSMARPLPQAQFVRFVAYSVRDHDSSLPLDYAREHVLLAHQVEGAPLTKEHGAPVRAVCAGKYFYKSVKWLRRIELLAEDQFGYWERNSAYHNNADPWREERYEPRPMPEAEFQRRLAARDFSSAFAIKDDQFKQLRGVDLSGANFQGAQIKACDLSHSLLNQSNCAGANFTLCKFNDARMQGTNLVGCDLEGADLRGADLSRADLRHASLTAARFGSQHKPAIIERAWFRRQDIETEGVDDSEQMFLLNPLHGAVFE